MTIDRRDTASDDGDGPVRSLFWVSVGFYVLIAFEFFYMASPFAAYFYAVYGPGMNGLEASGLADWTLWFFLPHIVVDTRSSLVNHAGAIGAALLLGGLFVFAIGAFRVYRAKLRGRGAVTGGLYAVIRHPQYAALIVASVGMLLVWPRFLVLFATATVVFAYVLLARAEESICLRRFPAYAAYRERVGMFVPRSWTTWLSGLGDGSTTGLARVLIWIAAFCLMLVAATTLAFGVRHHAIASLYTHRTVDGVYLSIVRLTDGDLERIARIAGGAPEARTVLDPLDGDGTVIAYVVPTEMYISEIPMRLPAGERFGHAVPHDRDPNRYKIVFTRALFGPGGPPPAAGNVLAEALNKRPLVEVHVNLGTDAVEAVHPPPETAFYSGRQVPVF